jgi:hypothetical protein
VWRRKERESNPGIGSRQWFSRPPPSSTRPSLRRPIFTYSSRSVRLSVYDAPPHSTAATLRLAQAADLVPLPTGLARDDLEPTVLLAHELIKKNVSKRKIAFALCRTGDSLIEVLEAQPLASGARRASNRRASAEGLRKRDYWRTSSASSASAIWMAIGSASAQGIGPRARRVASSSPFTSSITSARVAPASSTPWMCARFE